MIERAARGRDDDVDAAAQRPQLLLDRLSAVDGKNTCRESLTVAVHRFGNLHGELARRYKDERSHSRRFVGRTTTYSLEQWQCKGGRLARPCRCLPEHVPTLEQGWDCLALNRRGLFVAQSRER